MPPDLASFTQAPKLRRKLHGFGLSVQILTRRASEVRPGTSLTRFEVAQIQARRASEGIFPRISASLACASGLV